VQPHRSAKNNQEDNQEDDPNPRATTYSYRSPDMFSIRKHKPGTARIRTVLKLPEEREKLESQRSRSVMVFCRGGAARPVTLHRSETRSRPSTLGRVPGFRERSNGCPRRRWRDGIVWCVCSRHETWRGAYVGDREGRCWMEWWSWSA
jgi:hypothetical protein